VLAVESLERRQAGDLLARQFFADGFAERAIVGRSDVGIVARGVDGRHDGEKRGAGVELAPFGFGGLGGQGQQDDAR
jgi:hypothetical protein